MNADLRALDRALKAMARPRRRRPRFSTAPIVLALALGLGYVLLTRLVPRVWAELLPGGLAQARQLRGWPGLVWRLAVLGRREPEGAAIALGVVTVGSFMAIAVARPLRWLVWLAAVAAIAADGAILYVTLQTAVAATAVAAGIGS